MVSDVWSEMAKRPLINNWLIDPSHGDMAIYAMAGYFERVRTDGLNVSVRTTQDYLDGVEASCAWDWILTIGGRKPKQV
jgi:hypothetical protein